jgi:DNA helicase HerA-like ATPase
MSEKNNGQEFMSIDNEAFEQNSVVLPEEQTIPEIDEQPILEDQDTINALRASLIQLGFVNFDGTSADNSSSEAMVSAEHRKHFRRDVYVGIHDSEQNLDFLGRVVEGPFHAPHEVGIDSAITRTTVLHPDRTQFRPSYYVTGTIEILGQLVENERLVPSPTRPRPYSEIYIFPADRLQKFLDINGDFYLGQLMGYDKIKVLADVNSKNFLPRNVGVFGTVGSGKSNTTQVIIEEAINAGWAVVVVDVEGEYVKMNEPTTDARLIPILKDKYGIEPAGIEDFKVYVPQSGHSDATSPIRFKVPISALDPYVLSDLMELTEAQARLLEGIMERANSAAQRSSNRIGVLAQPNSSGNQTRGYTLQTLIDGLGNGGSLIPANTPQITVDTLRSKLIRLGMSQMLDWNKNSSIPELPVNDLLVGGRLSVLDVSETDDRSRNIAIAYTLQALFDRVIQTPVNGTMANGQLRPKILVVIEEVHTFVSRNNAARMRSVLDNMQVISRRGRKRWMSLALVSQQPGHVPDELFELANTRFIHQLKSASNLAPVKQTTGGVHEALWSNISSLGPGQCLVTGAIFNNPLFVEIRPAKTKRMHTT